MGHLSRKRSSVCYVLLGKTGSTITGTVSCRVNEILSQPSRPQGGLEVPSSIPWVMKFAGDIKVNAWYTEQSLYTT